MKRIGLITVVFLFLFPASFFSLTSSLLSETAIASEASQEYGGGEGEHEEGLFQIIGKWLNFFALVAILYLFLKKTIGVQEKFKANSEEIQKSIESARQAKEEAERRLQELDSRMRQISQDVERVKQAAAHEAEEEKKRILESAQEEAARIVESAHHEIDSEVSRARKELRKQVADLSIGQGRKIIEEEIDDQDHQRLIHSYIDEFGK